MKNKNTKVYMPNVFTGDFLANHYVRTTVSKVDLHHHDFYEVYLPVSDNVVFNIEGRIYEPKPNDILLINPSELHKAIIRNDKPYDRYVLWISQKFVDSLSTKMTDLGAIFKNILSSKKNLVQLPPKEVELIKNLINQIQANIEYDSSYDGNGDNPTISFLEYGQDVLCRLNIETILLILNGIKEDKNTINKVNNVHVDYILDFINNNFMNDISISTIADKFFISKSLITHLFKEHVGTTVHKFIIQKRLVHAKELIRYGWSISDVSEHSGFKDYSAFFRIFKSEYGLTPKEYYRLMNKENDVKKIKQPQ